MRGCAHSTTRDGQASNEHPALAKKNPQCLVLRHSCIISEYSSLTQSRPLRRSKTCTLPKKIRTHHFFFRATTKMCHINPVAKSPKKSHKRSAIVVVIIIHYCRCCCYYMQMPFRLKNSNCRVRQQSSHCFFFFFPVGRDHSRTEVTLRSLCCC